MRKRVLPLLILLAITPTAYAATGYRLVGHPRVPVSRLSKQAVSQIFMRRTVKWTDGTAIVAIDQSPQSPVRVRFTSSVFGKSVPAIVSYWRQQIFAGREVPPIEESSEAEVLARLRRTAGAIGYVSEEAAVDGLRVIEVE